MHHQPYVEILMATFNGERYVEEQIDSIMNQSYRNFHLIVRDDGSTDNTRALVLKKANQYPGRISLLPDTKNLGIIGNFSALMAHSKAPYVMLSDQDDLWMSEKVTKTLAKMVEAEAQEGSQVPMVVHTDLKVVDQELLEISPSFCQFCHLDPNWTDSLYKLLGQNTVTGCAMMVNRKLLELALPVPKESVMHDWWLALVGAAFGKIVFIPEATLLYRQHGSNQVGAKSGRFLHHLKRLFQDKKKYVEKAHSVLNKQERQAKAFAAQFEAQLTEKQKEQIEAYLKWAQGSAWTRIRLLIKHGNLKKGFLKNLALFAFRSSLGCRR